MSPLIPILLAAAAPQIPLETAESISRLSVDEYALNRKFTLTGTIVSCAKVSNFIIADTTGSALVWYNNTSSASQFHPSVGQVVKLTGRTFVNGDKLASLRLDTLETIGSSAPPPPVDISSSDLVSGSVNLKLVRLRGFVIDTYADDIDPDWSYFIIRSGDETIYAFIHRLGVSTALEKYRNAEVILTGPCIPNQGGRRLFLSPHIELRDESDISVVTPAPANPFEMPLLEDLRHISASKIASMGQRRICGHVTAVWGENNFLLNADDGRVVGVTTANGCKIPKFNTRVEAVGFPETDLYRINLSRAQWRTIGHALQTESVPLDVDPEELLSGSTGKQRLLPELHGKHIRIEGKVRNLPGSYDNDGRFNVSSSEHLIPIDISACPDAAGKLQIGSRIKITGICNIDTSNWTANDPIPRIRGFNVIVRFPEEITVISRPPWWTHERLLSIIGALFTALVSILIWNFSLRRLAERKGRELLKAEIGKAGAELRIGERTRLAVELHDSIAQNLTAISFQVASAMSSRDVAPDASTRHLENADRMLRSCRTELRRCLWDLRSDTLEEPDFAKAIRATVSEVLGEATAHIRFNVPRTHIRDTTAHAVLNIIRELTSNAVRHGNAQNVWIAGETDRRQLRFSVRDDGCGFDVAAAPSEDCGHFGLKGIRERLNPLDGSLQLTSDSRGTRAIVTLHLQRPEDETNGQDKDSHS